MFKRAFYSTLALLLAAPALAAPSGTSSAQDTISSLQDQGYTVVVNYASNDAAANDVVSAITAKGGKAVAIKGDVANCGGCGASCTAPPGATATCTGGVCR